jgi:DNA-binding transcriptional regulator GbsR (MarR family)
VDQLTPIQRDLVEEFGSIYESYGLERVKGLITGLMLTQSEALSLDDMASLLGRSKGPVSTAARALAEIGVLRKVDGPVNRRDYYAAHPDLFFNNFKHNMAIVRKNRRTAEQFLREFAAADSPAAAAATPHLEHMLAFYALMERFYASFSERWEQERPTR